MKLLIRAKSNIKIKGRTFVGTPMGKNPTSLIANLFLHFYMRIGILKIY